MTSIIIYELLLIVLRTFKKDGRFKEKIKALRW
jgi:hypothetical protein